MEIFENIKVMWGRVGLVQRALLLAIFMTFLIAGILLTYWARRPEMRLLYQDLAPDEAARITDKIAEQGIRYQLRDGGTTVYVPGKEVYQLRLDMAKEGLPSGGRE